MAFSQIKGHSWVMPLSFFILFLYSVGSDIQVWDFLSSVDSGRAEMTWNSSLSGRRELLERHLSFLSALSAVFLWNLVPSLTWWNISSIHIAQPKGIKTKWAILLRNSFREFYTLFYYFGMEKTMAPHSSVLCLENPRDGGVWWAAMYGVTRSWTRLKWLSSSSSSYYFGTFKTETHNHNSRVVWRPDPTSFLDGLCKEVVLLLF